MIEIGSNIQNQTSILALLLGEKNKKRKEACGSGPCVETMSVDQGESGNDLSNFLEVGPSYQARLDQ